MPLIRLDSAKLEMYVETGVLEEYKPDQDIEIIFKNVQDLKRKANDTVLQLCNVTDIAEVAPKLNSDENLRNQWINYLETEFKPLLEALIVTIENKNKQICPGYEAYLESLKNEHSK